MDRFISVIIPLYNRPDEIQELLESLVEQRVKNFEVIVIEDGSTNDAKDIVMSFADKLDVHYFFKENGGQGFARNYGFEKARGDWFIILDSDAIIPPHYFEAVNAFLDHSDVGLFGGPDAAHDSFTPIQKAISYSMTSLFTTGGIRGREKHVGTFHPRSFNMGVSRAAYEKVGGFKITRMGEDIEYSIRIIDAGFKSALIPEAYIYHKRRTSMSQFYKQLHFFGRARINISRFYPSELKLVHTFPALFLLAFIFWLSTAFWSLILFKLGSAFYLLYTLAIFIDSAWKNKSLYIGFLSSIAAYVQLFAYGVGFLTEGFRKLTKG